MDNEFVLGVLIDLRQRVKNQIKRAEFYELNDAKMSLYKIDDQLVKFEKEEAKKIDFTLPPDDGRF
ncbi:MAG: hypothetical protein IJ800_01840 [Clostridia bacterium]|nr:hypothetical protein [Clostridia bacterium]